MKLLDVGLRDFINVERKTQSRNKSGYEEDTVYITYESNKRILFLIPYLK